MSGKSSPKSSASGTPPRITTPRTTPPRTPTRTPPGSKSGSTARLTITPRRDAGNHSLGMCGSERYQNQINSTANAELFNGKKKCPSLYKRPEELGLSTTPMEDKSEIKRNFEPVNIGRKHIVKPMADHQETYQAAHPDWEEEPVKATESKSTYKDLQAKRPVCNKINDHLTVGIEGDLAKDSEVRATYKNLNAKRPVIHKLDDHTDKIQPSEPMIEASEYRSTINQFEGMSLKGERALPPWLGMKKVTPFGTGQDQSRE